MTVLKSSVKTRYYDVGVSGIDGCVEIRASHPKAKEVLWGWAGDYGSTKDRGAAELYGWEEELEHPMSRGDSTPWLWRLSAYGVNTLKQSFKLALAEPSRFEVSAFEARRYRELLDAIKRALDDARARVAPLPPRKP